MARIAQLEDNVFVASQLTEDEIESAAGRGIRSIVCNRPDGEAEDQIPAAVAEAAARRAGLEFRNIPVANHDVTDDEPVDAQADALNDLPGPILFYCRSGNRSTILWAQASAARLGADAVIERASAAGYNIAELRDLIADRASTLVY